MFSAPINGAVGKTKFSKGVLTMAFNVVRASVYAIAVAAMLGLFACSGLSNGYGGWYWQTATVPINPPSVTQNDTGNQSHASGISQTQQGTQG
jgi:hypothetical protein